MSADHPAYGEAGYWETRYSERPSEHFEWYRSYADLWPEFGFLFAQLPQNPRVLVVGNGNSQFPVELYDDANNGAHDIVATDISGAVTAQMGQFAENRPGLRFLVDNCTHMQFETAQFDLVFDKGTMDALMNNADPAVADRYIAEVRRVLKPTGVFVMVSYAVPYKRVDRFGPTWRLNIKQLPENDDDQTDHYVYICRPESA